MLFNFLKQVSPCYINDPCTLEYFILEKKKHATDPEIW